jgi:hypothetical protein
MYVCSECGSDDLEIKGWGHANAHRYDKIFEPTDNPDANDIYCMSCDNHVSRKSRREERAIEGFQIERFSEENDQIEIHPDMEGSFCLYPTSWARERSGKDGWQMKAYYEGEIEEPTIMWINDPSE